MKNPEYFKEKLEKEKKRLETELSSVGRINPENKEDWEATPDTPIDTIPSADKADKNTLADNFEEFEERTAVESELEIALGEVTSALQKIEGGVYGTCEVGNEPIEEDRLEVNPSARTCKQHME